MTAKTVLPLPQQAKNDKWDFGPEKQRKNPKDETESWTTSQSARKIDDEEKAFRFLGQESSLALYLKEIRKNRTLTAPEEAVLAVAIRQGDRKAMNTLIRANLKFVVSVCQKYKNQGLPMTDLINEGNLGLIRAARRFDETKQFKFISYAVWWIRQAILQILAEQSRMINIPLNRIATIHKVGKISGSLEQKLGRAPTNQELSEALCIKEKEINDSLQLSQRPISLDAPIHSDDESKYMDILKDETIDSPDSGLREECLKQEVAEVLETLNEKEKEVLKLYFGVAVETPHTLEDIGNRLGLTRERVRQIKEKALKKLQYSPEAQKLSIFRS